MDIEINSTPLTVPEDATLELALQAFGAQSPFAIALNGHFVARAAYGETLLHTGDSIELVRAVGGG